MIILLLRPEWLNQRGDPAARRSRSDHGPSRAFRHDDSQDLGVKGSGESEGHRAWVSRACPSKFPLRDGIMGSSRAKCGRFPLISLRDGTLFETTVSRECSGLLSKDHRAQQRVIQNVMAVAYDWL